MAAAANDCPLSIETLTRKRLMTTPPIRPAMIPARKVRVAMRRAFVARRVVPFHEQNRKTYGDRDRGRERDRGRALPRFGCAGVHGGGRRSRSGRSREN